MVFPQTTDEYRINFMNFSGFTLMPSVLLFLVTYLILEIRFMGLMYPKRKMEQFGIFECKKKLNLRPLIQKYRKVTSEEVTVLILFILLLISHITRTLIWQWQKYFDEDKEPLDSLTTVLLVVLYFAIPRNLSFFRYWIEGNNPLPRKEIPSIVKWEFLSNRLPWENFMITGCAAAISQSMVESRLIDKMLFLFDYTKELNKHLTIFIFVTTQYLLSQFTESGTTVNFFVELLKNTINKLKFHPLYFAMPIAFVGNMSFILPVSTPSNLIVQSFSNAKSGDYVFAGFFVTIFSYIIILCFTLFWTDVVFPGVKDAKDIFIRNTSTAIIDQYS